ncbi:MAG: DNA polymerase III subunit beta [Bacteroidales bacterium]|jgi:DNA polymerase-3 subunit beta|nr:DNA polymerase III subunit beta [Bacteroidales bacterium]MDD4545560.1 DNA polymerase III subunit beta [Bacteroidales bacterium]MDY0054537.1 DNA polymerase III subunit beta [Bacteroidales bacterium]
MKFIVHGGTLSRSLQSIISVITTNNAFPILENFLFELNGNILSITASDLETTAIVKLDLNDAEDDGLNKIAVNAKKLLDIVKTLENAPLTFNIEEEDYAIEITSGEGRYKITGTSSDEFPNPKAIENPQSSILPSTLLVNAISKTVLAAGVDELRPQMTGVFCEQTLDSITFVATDAHKLVRYRKTNFNNENETNFILPKKPLNLIKNILTSYKDEVDVLMEYNITNVSFTFENYHIVCRLIEGKYPNYDAAIPKENPNKLIIERNVLLSSVRRIAIFASQSTNQIILKFNGNDLIISAEDVDFSNAAKEKLSCNYTGEDLTIGFNAKYLIEMINNVETEYLSLEMSQPNRAGIIYPFEENPEPNTESILMLVMPVMLVN